MAGLHSRVRCLGPGPRGTDAPFQPGRGVMSMGWRVGNASPPCPRGLVLALATITALYCHPPAAGAESEAPKLVVVIYPHECDEAPGIILVNRAIRSTFAGQPSGHIEVRNEYVDVSRLRDSEFMQAQVSLLR